MSSPADQRLSSPVRDALVGRTVEGSAGARYYLRECVGEGGQGWVFRANWGDPSGHDVIVKVLRPDVIAGDALGRFRREAEVLRMLSTQGPPNPYVVRFYDHAMTSIASPFGGEALALPYTVLEYVHGTTLEQVMKEQGGLGLPVDRSRRILKQVAQALDHVHKHKVVHRDFKPSNILLATEAGSEVAKVTDFGLVKLVDTNLTRTASLAGASLGYAPPEQYEKGNQRVSPRTDVFSLAAVLFEMLTGRFAFPFNEGENPLLIVTRILNGARPRLTRQREALAAGLAQRVDLVESLEREIVKGLSADPAERHESALDFLAAVEPHLQAAIDERPPRSVVSPFEATARAMTTDMPAVAPARPPRIERPSAPAWATGTLPIESKPPVEAHAQKPASWQWAQRTAPLGAGALVVASMNPAGQGAIGLGPRGLYRLSGAAWGPVDLPNGVAPASVRGLRWVSREDVLVFGENGLVARCDLRGGVQRFAVPDAEVTFLGGFVDPNGTVTLVGERPYRGSQPRGVPGGAVGVVAQFVDGALQVLADAPGTARLWDATRTSTGQLLAVGDWGALVRIDLGVPVFVGTLCGGHLKALVAMDGGGALAVGGGGHALAVGARLDWQLEAVQTTRDLACVARSSDGQAWAGSAAARLLRRSEGTWLRMSGALGSEADVLSVAADTRRVRAILADGLVVEGLLT